MAGRRFSRFAATPDYLQPSCPSDPGNKLPGPPAVQMRSLWAILVVDSATCLGSAPCSDPCRRVAFRVAFRFDLVWHLGTPFGTHLGLASARLAV